jgi:hypothetical protein
VFSLESQIIFNNCNFYRTYLAVLPTGVLNFCFSFTVGSTETEIILQKFTYRVILSHICPISATKMIKELKTPPVRLVYIENFKKKGAVWISFQLSHFGAVRVLGCRRVCVSVYYIREGVRCRFVFVRVVLLCFTPSEQRRASDSLSHSGTLPGHARPPEIEFKLQQQKQKQSKFCVSALHDFGTQISETLKAPASK